MIACKEVRPMSNMKRSLAVLSAVIVVALVAALPVVAESEGFKYEEGKPYVMPGHFGAANQGWNGEVAHYDDNIATTISYVTDRDAVAALLPPGFTPTDPAVVSVTHVMCRGVDFMAGRGYNLVSVNVSARYEGKQDKEQGDFALVLWENDFFPIMLGREVLGAPKLYGEIPDTWSRDGRRGFSVSEYGTLLLEGEVWDLHAPSEAEMKALSERPGGIWMGWKFIPSPDLRGADVSYPTALPSRGETKEILLGKGKIEFRDVMWEESPLSSRVIKALKKLPIVEYRGATVTRGWNELLIHKQRSMR